MTQYRGPHEPFPFASHRSLDEADADAPDPRMFDPDWNTVRCRADIADKRFTAAMRKSMTDFSGGRSR